MGNYGSHDFSANTNYWLIYTERILYNNVEGREYADVNIGILDMGVLITLMRLERYDWSQFLQSHLSLF